MLCRERGRRTPGHPRGLQAVAARCRRLSAHSACSPRRAQRAPRGCMADQAVAGRAHRRPGRARAPSRPPRRRRPRPRAPPRCPRRAAPRRTGAAPPPAPRAACFLEFRLGLGLGSTLWILGAQARTTQTALLCTLGAPRQAGAAPLPSRRLRGPAGAGARARLVHERRQLGLREQAAGEAAQVRDGEAGDRRVRVARRGHQVRGGGRPQPAPHQPQAAQVGAGRGRQAAQRVRPARTCAPGLESAGRAGRRAA